MYGRFFPQKNSSSQAKVYQQINDKEKLIGLFESTINSFENEHLNVSLHHDD